MSLHHHKPPSGGSLAGGQPQPRAHTPRYRIAMSDGQIVDHFRRFGYRVKIGQIAFTIESIADFVEARERFWSKAGLIRIYDPPGLLVVEDAKPREMQPVRDIVVVSLGSARAVMGVMQPDHTALSPRYARFLE